MADRLHFVGIEGDERLDGEHLVVGRLVGPHRVLGPALEREVGCRPLERAIGLVIGAAQPLHPHVLAREVVHRRVVALLQPDRLGAVGDHLAVELHLHAHARRLRGETVVGMLPVAGTAVGVHRFSFSFTCPCRRWTVSAHILSMPSISSAARGVGPAATTLTVSFVLPASSANVTWIVSRRRSMPFSSSAAQAITRRSGTMTSRYSPRIQ